jgi:hypothetical protein
VIEQLEHHLRSIRCLVGAVEPSALGPADARRLLELATALERLGGGLKLAVTPKALQGAPWGEEGYHSEAAWLASQLRSSVPQAVTVKQHAASLERLPATARAALRGSLSSTEVAAIAGAADTEVGPDPHLEENLLEAASTMEVHELLRYARAQARVARDNDPGQREHMSARRYLNFWSDAEGMVRLSGALLPEDGMEVVGAVRSMAEHLASEARRAGEQTPPAQALWADALVALVRGDMRRATFLGPQAELAPRAKLVLLVNLESLRRGAMDDDECCEVPGVGPVPLKVAESLLGDALLTMVIRDGVDVRTVVHQGRLVPAHVRSALEVRDRCCVVPGCRVELGLEIDHWQVPFAQGGPSALWNLCRLCKLHHRMKTYDGYVLSGGPDKWEWQPPT